MKNRKILLLLAVILCVGILFTACDNTKQGNDEKEILSYLKAEIEPTPLYDEISKLEGESVDYDADENLVVMRTTDLDNMNYVIETYKVYDLVKNEVIFEKTNKYLYNETEDQTKMSVEIEYPLIVVTETKYNEKTDSYGNTVLSEKYSSYYVAAKDGKELASNAKNADLTVHTVKNLYACTVTGTNQTTYWLDSDLNVMRTEAAVANAGDYSYSYNFFAEYNGYLYSSDESTVTVYDKDGMVSAVYTASTSAAGLLVPKAIVNAYVLNNGYVLIQEMIPLASDAEEYDVMATGMKVNIETYVMDHRDGELKEVEVDFVISELESAYTGATNTGYSSFPFKLVGENENQAYVYTVKDGSYDIYDVKYVVIDNDLNITYTVKTNFEYNMFDESEAVTENLFVMEMPLGANNEQAYLLDVDGTVISPITSEFEVVGNNILTWYGIYDMSMKLVYDFTATEWTPVLDTDGENIFVTRYNNVNDTYETYTFDSEKAELVLLADGIKTELSYLEEGAYCIYDIENEKYIIYNTEGKEIFVSAEMPDVTVLDDVIIISIRYNNEDVNYVIK